MGAVFILDEGHDLLQEKFAVAVGAAAAELGNFAGGVFLDARFAGVVDADDDERLEGARLDQIISCAVDVPVLPSEGGGAVEKILAVVEIEDWEAALWWFVVARWDVDDQVALIAQEARAELLVFAELA